MSLGTATDRVTFHRHPRPSLVWMSHRVTLSTRPRIDSPENGLLGVTCLEAGEGGGVMNSLVRTCC